MTDRSSKVGEFLTAQEKSQVEEAIKEAEKKTSGEIRVLISKKSKGDPKLAAQELFLKAKMDQTRDRNGVLIMLAVASHTFAIVGDVGIHKVIGQEGWDAIKDRMTQMFKADDFGGGLAYAVREVGRVLAQHFPFYEGDVNELSDKVEEVD